MIKPFYIQDTRQYVGNCMVWWGKDNCGYVCDIRQARIFAKGEAKKICKRSDGTKKMWPKKYIDKRVEHHIDMQNCDNREALKGS